MDGWGAVLVLAVGVLWGAAVARLVVGSRLLRLRGEVDDLRTQLRASFDSTLDVGWLMARQRARFDEQVAVYEAIVHMAVEGAAAVIAERDESRAASRLALTFYGREVDRADAAEAALEREAIVAAGVEAWPERVS